MIEEKMELWEKKKGNGYKKKNTSVIGSVAKETEKKIFARRKIKKKNKEN